jgi:hypothetical protein
MLEKGKYFKCIPCGYETEHEYEIGAHLELEHMEIRQRNRRGKNIYISIIKKAGEPMPEN